MSGSTVSENKKYSESKPQLHQHTHTYIDIRSKTIVFGFLRNLNNALYTVPDSIFESVAFDCLLFYHIDSAQARTYSNIYNLYFDPEYCGHDIELSQWYSALTHNDLSFTGSESEQKQIFDYMDTDRDGWVHRSDFVTFVTSRFQNQTSDSLPKLQKLLLDCIDLENISADRQQRCDKCIKQRLKTLDLHCKMVRKGIKPRQIDDPQIFDNSNVENWVIHQVIYWMDNIGMEKYSKCFADFERPFSGQRLLNEKNIYFFRLEIDFEIETFDALFIVKEIDKLRSFLTLSDNNQCVIDYVEEAKWLRQSFWMLSDRLNI